jgi:LAO/AO transport system kinase
MAEDLAQRIAAGDARALARAATLVENGGARAQELLAALGMGGGALVVGVTGPPGAGKSTLVDQLAVHYRQEGKRVAVIAVDPTSPISGGAILGDRIRMLRHHDDPGVFIRSAASRGAPGGLSAAVRGLVRLFDSAGWEVILIETVGVGQGEVEIARIAPVTVVTLAPGSGDDIQAMKAGILEIASVLVINKADLPGANQLETELHTERPNVPVVKTVASSGQGIAEAVAAIASAAAQALPASARTGQEFSIDHLGVAVRSIDEAIEFWSALLGMQVSLRETVAQEKTHAAMLPAGDSRIELLEAAEPGSVIGRFVEKRGPGLHHLALRVRHFPETLERLRGAGARLLNEPRRGAGGHTYVFVHPETTGGVLLELIEEESE